MELPRLVISEKQIRYIRAQAAGFLEPDALRVNFWYRRAQSTHWAARILVIVAPVVFGYAAVVCTIGVVLSLLLIDRGAATPRIYVLAGLYTVAAATTAMYLLRIALSVYLAHHDKHQIHTAAVEPTIRI